MWEICTEEHRDMMVDIALCTRVSNSIGSFCFASLMTQTYMHTLTHALAHMLTCSDDHSQFFALYPNDEDRVLADVRSIISYQV